MVRHFIACTLFFFFASQVLRAQQRPIHLPEADTQAVHWADSVYASLDTSAKIGQLYMIAAYSGTEKFNQPLIEKLIQEEAIGGLIFMQGTPSAQAALLNRYQKMSTIPLWVAMDAEWGLGMRLTGVRDFPRQMMLGAVADSTLVYKMGSAIAEQCRLMGVQINFAPVADVNNNPLNPVINSRSFGERKEKVTQFAIQYMTGLQENGVMACAKHFPGHGDTDADSHQELPVIRKSKSELQNLELYPFRKLIDAGIQSVMVAHLQVPAIDSREHIPTTLSEKAIGDVLRGELQFEGLVFTDALNMQGIAKYYSPGDIDLKAFLAGNDVLLFSQDVPAGKEKIRQALALGQISEERLAYSVKKVLRAKYRFGLSKRDSLTSINLEEQLNKTIVPLRTQIADAAITLLQDPHQLLDKIKRKQDEAISYVGIGTDHENEFSLALRKQGITHPFFFTSGNGKARKKFLHKLHDAGLLIVGIHGMSPSAAAGYGLSTDEMELLRELTSTRKVVVVLFGNPYAIRNVCDEESTFLIGYDEAPETQLAMARILHGEQKARGRLPVTLCEKFKAGDGIVPSQNVLGEWVTVDKTGTQAVPPKSADDRTLICCVSPGSVGADGQVLDQLDQYLTSCVQAGAFPGCRVLAARAGKVFYDKSFGTTGLQATPVEPNTVYDLASITKVAATTLALMKLYDEGKLNLNATLGTYWPACRGTDKESLLIRDIMAHQAGLKSWIPFYKETLDSTGHPDSKYYRSQSSLQFNIRVADKLFIRNDWVDSMWSRMLLSPLENKGKYVYSDIDFLFMQKVVEQISGKPLDLFVSENFYKPLQLKHTAFQPKRFLQGRSIAPGEADQYFRYQDLQGDVHDMAAAMFGGVSGHAGLFSTANELGILFQMLLNGGLYDGKRYLKKETVKIFTARNSSLSRRALGFDKPEFMAGKGSPCTPEASQETFGHQGFTGTCVWADPKNDLLYVFLSNRTYPSADNKLITRMNIREKTQEYIYRSLGIAAGIKK